VIAIIGQGATTSVDISAAIGPTEPIFSSYLTEVAKNHDKYLFTAMEFRWIPSCPTTSSGQVAMYFDPDCKDDAVTVFEDACNQGDALVTNIYEPATLVVPAKWLAPMGRDLLFVETDQGSEALLRYVGVLNLLTSGGTVLGGAGRLEVHYDVLLYCPNVVPKFPKSYTVVSLKTTVPLPIAPITAQVIADSLDPLVNEINDIALIPSSGGTFLMPKGTWEVSLRSVMDLPAGDIFTVDFLVNGASVRQYQYTNTTAAAMHENIKPAAHFKSDGLTQFAVQVVSILGLTLIDQYLFFNAK
jgi:hypothetical protein